MKLQRGWRPSRGAVQADINVTPLVDVVLVLLIIFMVVGPAIAEEVPVEMPQTLHHTSKPDDGRDVIVVVNREGRVFLAGNPVALEDVARLVEAERGRSPRRGSPGKTVYLRADRATDYGRVRTVMEAIRKASVEEVLLGTLPVRPEAQPDRGTRWE